MSTQSKVSSNRSNAQINSLHGEVFSDETLRYAFKRPPVLTFGRSRSPENNFGTWGKVGVPGRDISRGEIFYGNVEASRKCNKLNRQYPSSNHEESVVIITSRLSSRKPRSAIDICLNAWLSSTLRTKSGELVLFVRFDLRP